MIPTSPFSIPYPHLPIQSLYQHIFIIIIIPSSFSPCSIFIFCFHTGSQAHMYAPGESRPSLHARQPRPKLFESQSRRPPRVHSSRIPVLHTLSVHRLYEGRKSEKGAWKRERKERFFWVSSLPFVFY